MQYVYWITDSQLLKSTDKEKKNKLIKIWLQDKNVSNLNIAYVSMKFKQWKSRKVEERGQGN